MARQYYFNHTELDFAPKPQSIGQDILKIHAITESHAHALLDDGSGYAFVFFDDNGKVANAGWTDASDEEWAA